MSSDWQPWRAPLFDLWLAPPGGGPQPPAAVPVIRHPQARHTSETAGSDARQPPACNGGLMKSASFSLVGIRPSPFPPPQTLEDSGGGRVAPPAEPAREAPPQIPHGAEQATPVAEADAPDTRPGAARPAQEEAAPPPARADAAEHPSFTARGASGGWAVAAVSESAPVAVALIAEGERVPPQRLHPAERSLLERMRPEERAEARRLLAAARKAVAAALGMPEAAVAAAADLSPLLRGVQSLRVGDWSVQRVPAPPGVYLFAAAPGAGWSYRLAGGPDPLLPAER